MRYARSANGGFVLTASGVIIGGVIVVFGFVAVSGDVVRRSAFGATAIAEFVDRHGL